MAAYWTVGEAGRIGDCFATGQTTTLTILQPEWSQGRKPMRHSLCLRIGHLMCLGFFVIALWDCAAPMSLVGNPAFDGIYEGNPIADPENRGHRCPLSSHEVVSVRNGEATLATSNNTKIGVVQADGKLVMTGAHLIKILGVVWSCRWHIYPQCPGRGGLLSGMDQYRRWWSLQVYLALHQNPIASDHRP